MTDPRLPSIAPGACIALVAPASAPDEATVRTGIARLEELGFAVRPHLPARSEAIGRLAASDRLRAAHVVAAFDDPAVDAVLAVCGGYGVMRLAPFIPERLFRGEAKPLIGYSDVTPLLALASDRCAPALHGPMLCDLGAADAASLRALAALLTGDLDGYGAILAGLTEKSFAAVGAGVAGALHGGNLSLLAAKVGTGWPQLPGAGAIVFLEDWNEPAYRVDRMLVQLAQSGGFDSVQAILLGHFTNIGYEEEQIGAPIAARVRNLAARGTPVLEALPAGHAIPHIALALGVRYAATAGGLSLDPR